MILYIKDGAFESLVVVRILLLIGCLTALWRATGTIGYFVYYGIKIIPSGMFILAAFLLCAVMSYALGTSFGVSGTVGVILMAMAHAGGVNHVITAGAMLSGVYFGDRGAPASSCASLVASITKTRLNDNIKHMLKSSLFPMLICIAVYGALSIPNGLHTADSPVLALMEKQYILSHRCMVPVVLLIVLVFLGIGIKTALLINIAFSIVLAVVLQGMNLPAVLLAMIMGYNPTIPELSEILTGGGLRSLVQVISIVFASCAIAGIFRETGMLANLENKLSELSIKRGRFTAMVVTAIFTSAVFCNQTIGVIMSKQFMSKCYGDSQEERTEFMMDISNSVVVISGIVPWSIACSVPLAMMGSDFRSIPFAIYLYMVPICWYIQRVLIDRKRRKVQ
jgi:NhaC family Na+:H+ antiporter